MRVLSYLVLAVVFVTSLGCRTPTVIPSATPATPGASVYGLVLGRIQVSLAGQPVRVGSDGHGVAGSGPGWDDTSPWSEPPAGLSGETSQTMLVFQRLDGGGQFAFEVTDESGRFEVLLPQGWYGIQLRCGKWIVETPARFNAPEGGSRYYVGTLKVNMFQRRSFFGWFVRFFGGTLRSGDTGFAVVDEWQWAQANLQSLAEGAENVEKHLMRLEQNS